MLFRGIARLDAFCHTGRLLELYALFVNQLHHVWKSAERERNLMTTWVEMFDDAEMAFVPLKQQRQVIAL
jgi:hypothetical protein